MNKIMTLNPDPKTEGENIDKAKYDFVKDIILKSVSEKPQTFMELRKVVEAEMADFDGSPGWYYTTVKLDLEARGEIVCDRTGDQQQICAAS